MNEGQALTALSALAEPTRLAILRWLVRQGLAGAAAGEIAVAAGASPSRASFHLAVLERAGLVTSTRAARRMIYTVDLTVMGGLLAFLLADCCADDPTVRACCASASGSDRPDT
ncbi:MAG: metalloregulator ArsR/SmtB family transcription factor [Jannaschia sp.]